MTTFDLRPILFIIGILLSVLSISMVLPMLVDLYEQSENWKIFFLSIIVTAFFGGALILGNADQDYSLTIPQAFLTTVLGWLVIAAFSALPFFLAPIDMTAADAFFEAMSGITTTGATMLKDINDAPAGILLWRGLLQWLGGIGILLMGLTIMPYLRVGGMQIFRIESVNQEKSIPRAVQLSINILMIYVCLTLLCLIGYLASGFSSFEATIHAMTTISTGGFSTTQSSFEDFNNAGAETVAIIFMILSGMPFLAFLRAIQGHPGKLFKSEQVHVYLGLIFLASLILGFYLFHIYNMDALSSVRQSVFTVVSMMTGTGYTTFHISSYGGFAVSIALFLMVIGGCAGSTTCGIKVFRFQILYEVAKAQILKLRHPSGVFVPTYNKLPLPRGTILSIMSFFFAFSLVFIFGVVSLSYLGLDFMTAISATISCLSNVGPGLGPIIEPPGTYYPIPDSAKCILSFIMLLGRVELFTVLVLFSPYFWQR